MPALAVFLLGCGAVLVAVAPGTAESLELREGRDFPVNAGAADLRDINAHNSPVLVRNPVAPDALAIANRIDSPAYSCALHLSFDGGATWRQTPLPVPPGEEPKCYAPEVAYGADGSFSLLFVTLQGLGNVPNAVWFVTSKDGGLTLSNPVKVLDRLSFQVRLIADPVTPGRLYMTWLRASATALYSFPDTNNPIVLARSDDGGATWSAPVQVSSSGRQRVVAPSAVIGPRGEVYVLFKDLGEDRLDYHGAHEGRGGEPYAGEWQLVLARSADGGATFSETVVEESLVPTERFIVFIPPSPSLAVDRRSGRIYVSYHDGRRGDPDVMLWSSIDRGATFSAGHRVNDTPIGDGTSQYLPKLAVSPSGRLDVVYYDRRHDPKDVRNGVSLQSSFDGGKSFTPHLSIASKAFDSGIGFGSERGLPDLGARLGLLSTPTEALAVWTDTRSGTQASNKQDLYRAVVHMSPASDLSDTTEKAVGIPGAAMLVGSGAFLAWNLGHRRRPEEYAP